MNNNLNECEITQLSISDKFDASIALDHSEIQHLDCCSECLEFYHFVHGDSLLQIANAPAGNTFDIEKVTQAAAIMERLTKEESAPVKRSNIIRLSIASAAIAAIAAVTISQVIQPSTSDVDSSASTSDIEAPKKKISLPDLSLPKIKFDEGYSAINTVVINRIESVSHGIIKLKACFIEGNAFLDEHTQSEPAATPESRYYDDSSHSNIG